MSDPVDPPIGVTIIGQHPGDKHTHTVIFLHGCEDYGSYLAHFFLR